MEHGMGAMGSVILEGQERKIEYCSFQGIRASSRAFTLEIHFFWTFESSENIFWYCAIGGSLNEMLFAVRCIAQVVVKGI